MQCQTRLAITYNLVVIITPRNLNCVFTWPLVTPHIILTLGWNRSGIASSFFFFWVINYKLCKLSLWVSLYTIDM